jgi:hypothetical protein
MLLRSARYIFAARAGEDMHSRRLLWTPARPLLTTVDATATGLGALCEPS